MYKLDDLLLLIDRLIVSHPRPGRFLGYGRSLLALAQASVVLLTPSAYFFVPLGDQGDAIDCDAVVRAANPFCFDGVSRQLVAWVLGAAFLLIVTGIWPRVTSVIHFAATYALSTAISLPDGGEAVALVVTFFLVFALIDDGRRWHWTEPVESTHGFLRGVGAVGMLLVKVQVAYIYLNSSLAKLSVDAWQNGTATYYVARMESFGAAGFAAPAFRWATATPVTEAMFAWGTVVGEFAIAVLLLLPRRAPVMAFGIAAFLHIGIILFLGIFSFGLTMIGVVMMAASSALSGWFDARGRRSRRDTPEVVGSGSLPAPL